METLSVLKKVMTKELNRSFDDLTVASTFKDINLDSLDVVQVIMAIEEEFDIEIADDAAESFVTMGDFIDYIEATQK